jgi:hypothetical protein
VLMKPTTPPAAESKKVFQDFFKEHGAPNHLFPTLGHPPCG